LDEKYNWTSYGAVGVESRGFAGGLLRQSVRSGDRVGIFLPNGPDFVTCDLGCAYGGFVSVPMYETFDDEALTHVVIDAQLAVVVCSSALAERAIKLLESVPLESRTVRLVVINKDNAPEDLRGCVRRAEAVGATVRALAAVQEAGFDSPPNRSFVGRPLGYPSLDDTYTICYTSGTTGPPKGVVLSHRNVIAEVTCLLKHMTDGKFTLLSSLDTHASYLPMAHIMERVVTLFMLFCGARIGFTTARGLSQDLPVLQPTVLVAVPRVLARLREGTLTKAEASGWLGKTLFYHALSTKLARLRVGKVSHPLWDRLVFNKVRESLGGKLRVILCGSAPLTPDLADFVRVTCGAELYEGYGQTETCSAVTLTARGELEGGHAGLPLSCFEVRLDRAPVADAEDQRLGEIQLRGGPVFSGYNRLVDKTAECFTEDGWYRTGDIGMWDHKGRLVVTERLKNVFKLSQGEFVSPEKVEVVISTRVPSCKTVFVTGRSSEDHLVAVVELAEACDEQALLDEIQAACREGGLRGFEVPRKVVVRSFPESVFTPTLKVRREVAKRHFEKDISEMYK
jgi:long-chain acyl-CoA synthetase